MKAAFYNGNKSITIGESVIQKPQKGEVRLEISYCGVCGTDLHIYHGAMDKRVKMPQIMGHEMSGKIVEVGPEVDGFDVGDTVVVRPLVPCNNCPACKAGHGHICQNLKFLGIDTPGAFQRSWTVPAYTLHHLPEAVSLKEAALIEPIAVACHDIKMGEIKKGEYVVVIGGGPIGLLIAMIAQKDGARVILSEIDSFRRSFAEEVGIETINPKQMDIVDFVEKQTNGAGADVVFEVSGSAAGLEIMTKLPRTRGRIVVVAIVPEPRKIDVFRFFWRELKMFGARVYTPDDFERAIELVAEKALPFDRLITKCYPIDELGKAMASMASGGDVMKVLIKTGD